MRLPALWWCLAHGTISPAIAQPASEAPVSEIVGVAQNGKGGALLLREESGPLYVDGLSAWPAGVAGLPVAATGRVVQRRYVPEATVGPDGSWSAGSSPGSGLDLVLEDPRWHLVGAGQGIEPGPWSLTFADGNGNVTRVARAPGQTAITWSYDPIRPEESSSGTYSGGEPGQGALAEAEALQLWERVRALQSDPAVRAAQRELGTGRLEVVTVGGRAELLLVRGPTAELARLLAAQR
jgi:hypothetical protein